MTNSSDEITTDLDEATAKFVALENFSKLESSLAKSGSTSAVILTFQDYWSAATYPERQALAVAHGIGVARAGEKPQDGG